MHKLITPGTHELLLHRKTRQDYRGSGRHMNHTLNGRHNNRHDLHTEICASAGLNMCVLGRPLTFLPQQSGPGNEGPYYLLAFPLFARRPMGQGRSLYSFFGRLLRSEPAFNRGRRAVEAYINTVVCSTHAEGYPTRCLTRTSAPTHFCCSGTWIPTCKSQQTTHAPAMPRCQRKSMILCLYEDPVKKFHRNFRRFPSVTSLM